MMKTIIFPRLVYAFGKLKTSFSVYRKLGIRGRKQVYKQCLGRRSLSTAPAYEVEILVGKDKGKQGIVNFIIKERNWCFVEGRHCRFEIEGKSSTSPGIMKREEMPLLVTNEIALVDPFDNTATEVEWRHQEDGQKVRVSLRTGRIVPIPDEANDYHEDYTKIGGYKAGDKDTSNDALKKVTYKPILKSFEQDLMDIMGIKEDREPGKTYWY